MKKEISLCWEKIAPFWPLKNLIAVNPLQGFECYPFEDAVLKGAGYFQNALPPEMVNINRETIKWCQVYFDEGQATISMPLKHKGFYGAWKRLVVFDRKLVKNQKDRQWVSLLPDDPELAIQFVLDKLNISEDGRTEFLTFMLTSLPGWAAHIKYKTEWVNARISDLSSVNAAEYLAIRVIITCLLWKKAKDFALHIAPSMDVQHTAMSTIEKIRLFEEQYQPPLLQKLTASAHLLNQDPQPGMPDAQLAFCIDVRSEPFRRALESTGNYDTYGVAGFFGLPIAVKNIQTQEAYDSCPVLINPTHTIHEIPSMGRKHFGLRQQSRDFIKLIYQSLKYNFTTPVALVELLGPLAGIYAAIKTFAPNKIEAMKSKYFFGRKKTPCYNVSIEDLPVEKQCIYAKSILTLIGLTKNFSKLVVFCGHGSTTKNNAYATSLDCGACGGRHGAVNAKTLAKILNNPPVRAYLSTENINIPTSTFFMAAEHNTTTDEVTLFYKSEDKSILKHIAQLKKDLLIAGHKNRAWRSLTLGGNDSSQDPLTRSNDWAQVRPEWGLARNASFIVGPRILTKDINLEGRSFLHSYDYRQDVDGSSLTAILTAPMVVAQWINAQYLFSTIDNIAYGSGSKVTKNITGKIGIMQGNASDLMHGLPLQSVNISDHICYHEPQRLITVVYAPRHYIEKIIAQQAVLQKLFKNGWIQLACIDPENSRTYQLTRNLSWT